MLTPLGEHAHSMDKLYIRYHLEGGGEVSTQTMIENRFFKNSSMVLLGQPCLFPTLPSPAMWPKTVLEQVDYETEKEKLGA